MLAFLYMLPALAGPPAASELALGIPAYLYPGLDWARMSAAPGAVQVIIANPSSGPGGAIDPAYDTAIRSARSAGVTVLGYVHTSYGARDSSEVDEEIADWYDWYEISGIFFDEVSGTDDCTDTESWYQRRASVVRDYDEDAVVVLNPGTDTCESFLDFADILVVIEDNGFRVQRWAAPDWLADYDRARFWLLAHSTPGIMLPRLLDKAVASNVGLVYITNDRLPNPWDTLPSYWSALVEAVED